MVRKKPGRTNNGGGGKGKKASAAESTGGSKRASNKGSRKSNRAAGAAGAKFSADVLNDEAMLDAYYTCHNVMHLLHCRGFPWPDAPKKKKKSKK